MRKSNGFALILFFFIIAFVAGAIFLLKKGNLNLVTTSNSPANWETYTGSDFQVKCPPGWKIERSVGLNEVDCDNGNLSTPMFVGVQVLGKGQDTVSVSKLNVSNTVINSIQAKIYDEEAFDGSKTINTAFSNYRIADIEKGSILYRVYLAATSKKDILNNLQLFNQILSTFKFID